MANLSSPVRSPVEIRRQRRTRPLGAAVRGRFTKLAGTAIAPDRRVQRAKILPAHESSGGHHRLPGPVAFGASGAGQSTPWKGGDAAGESPAAGFGRSLLVFPRVRTHRFSA
ncbi:hypothetical protein FAIPA1_180062 [Frankia sp. AiPs1]